MQFTIHLNRFVILLLSTLTLIAGSAQAEEASDLPPWLTPSLAKKIVEIDMNSDQRTLFRSELTGCLEGLRNDVTKIMRRGGSDLRKKVERARKRRFGAFEDTMFEALSPNQHDAFKSYLAEQIEVLNNMNRR